VLEGLKALGVSLAIDDFGTGYSCLGYLGRLPVDVLKLDKSFVDRIAPGAPGAAVANTIIDLGRKLGLVTVAEGIERPEQLEQLRRRGCELGQGHLFARPLADAAVERMLGAATQAPARPPLLRASA
jgi:EAL domain-containing protein (putative c-di-GMP-specific phosphodiesterase class I)